jgi:hypothetical protein
MIDYLEETFLKPDAGRGCEVQIFKQRLEADESQSRRMMHIHC